MCNIMEDVMNRKKGKKKETDYYYRFLYHGI